MKARLTSVFFLTLNKCLPTGILWILWTSINLPSSEILKIYIGPIVNQISVWLSDAVHCSINENRHLFCKRQIFVGFFFGMKRWYFRWYRMLTLLAPKLTRFFIHSRLIKWVPGFPRNPSIQSKPSPHSCSAALVQLDPIFEVDHKVEIKWGTKRDHFLLR